MPEIILNWIAIDVAFLALWAFIRRKNMAWVIANKQDPEVCWSNAYGWCDTTYDTFSDEEKETLNLPIDGEWEEVPWTKED